MATTKSGSVVAVCEGKVQAYLKYTVTETATTYKVAVDYYAKVTVKTVANPYIDFGLSAEILSGSIATAHVSYNNPRAVSDVKVYSRTKTYTKTTSTQSFTTKWGFGKANLFGEFESGSTVSLSLTVPALAKYTVSYNANGGSGAPSSQTKWYGKTLTLSSTKPTRTGYTFKGWAKTSTGSVAYQPGSSYTANAAQTLYAVWQINTYAVTYNANGGEGAPANQTKTYGTALTLSSVKPTKEGYNFTKWNTKADGTGTDYNAGASYTANAAVTLYAQWQIKTYSITYDANGGTGAPAEQTKTHGVDIDLSTTEPTRYAYKFSGWSTSLGGAVEYQAGDTYTNDEPLNLYAVWEQRYFDPTITNLTATRALYIPSSDSYIDNDEGTAAHVKFNWTPAMLDGLPLSPTACYIGISEQDADSYTETQVPITSGSINAFIDTPALSDLTAYDIRVRFDMGSWNGITSYTYITIAYFAMDVNADLTSIAFGKAAEDNFAGVVFGTKMPPYADLDVEIDDDPTSSTYERAIAGDDMDLYNAIIDLGWDSDVIV